MAKMLFLKKSFPRQAKKWTTRYNDYDQKEKMVSNQIATRKKFQNDNDVHFQKMNATVDELRFLRCKLVEEKKTLESEREGLKKKAERLKQLQMHLEQERNLNAQQHEEFAMMFLRLEVARNKMLDGAPLNSEKDAFMQRGAIEMIQAERERLEDDAKKVNDLEQKLKQKQTEMDSESQNLKAQKRQIEEKQKRLNEDMKDQLE